MPLIALGLLVVALATAHVGRVRFSTSKHTVGPVQLFLSSARLVIHSRGPRGVMGDASLEVVRERIIQTRDWERAVEWTRAHRSWQPGWMRFGKHWAISLPLWLLAIPLLAPLWAWWRFVRRHSAGECTACGYSRTGLRGMACPECGAAAPDAPASQPPHF
jgi:hypothetical protein